MVRRPIVLFLCTGNSCRSQMAAGLTRHVHGDWIDARSAGVEAHGLNPNAVAAMAEIDIDISDQVSSEIDSAAVEESKLIVTVCEHAHGTCPLVPDAKSVIHRAFDDPPRLIREALQAGHTGLDPMAPYRRVREEIRTFVELELPRLLD